MSGKFKDSGIARAFRHRDFAIFSAAAWVSNVGNWIMRIGIGWLTWDLTHSGAWLGGIALIQAMPTVFLTPVAGALADRYNRILILQISQASCFVFAVAITGIILMDLVNIYVLAGYSLLHGIAANMGIPARITIGPNLVPKEDISAAVAVSSILFGSATFIGPAAAGILIAWIGIGFTFAANAVAFLTMVICLSMITLARTENRSSGSSILMDIAEGVRYVGRHGGIFPILFMIIMAALLTRPLNELLPGFADAVFGRGAEGLATLMSAFGVGGMVGSLWLAGRNQVKGTTNLVLFGSAGVGIMTSLFASTDDFYVAVGCIVALGLVASISSNGAQILIHNAVEGSMRARVMSLYSFNYRAAPAVGAMAMGSASSIMGFQMPVALGALLFLGAWYWVFLRRAKLRGALEGESDGGD
ncbi:MAG: MFS transporter [Rhodospirillales bacterium]|nr:MFS transporter [Rhodospirillales bacterium]